MLEQLYPLLIKKLKCKSEFWKKEEKMREKKERKKVLKNLLECFNRKNKLKF